MELINKIADTLYQNLASKFGEVNIADEGAGSVLESEQARLFDFNYIVEGNKYGPVTISIIDPANFTIYFAESLSGDLPDSIQRSWFGFLKEMRKFAKRNMMNFDVRNIGKNQLDKRDYEAITKNSSQYTTDEITMESVSRMYGSTKTSYQTVESAKIIVKHRAAIDEDKRGSRSRQIQAIFIENSSKERFKFPFKYLPGARAMARHVNAGGNPHDELGSHIVECVKEMYDLRNFVRKLNRADGFVNEESADIISDAKKRYKGLKETVATLSRPKGYKIYAENFKPTESEYDDSDLDELKGKLIRNVDQTELESLLPTVLKARKKVQEDMEPLHDIIQGKTKIVVTPNEEEDSLIKKQFEFVQANKFKKPNDTEGLDHTENPTHSLIRRILTTISVRTKDDNLARSIFNLDDSFQNKHDADMMTAVASKWLKGDVEVQDFDPKYKVKEPVEEFEKWADSVVREGTWHLPTSDEDVEKFKEIMAKPIIAGEDGQSATDAIGEVFGDDELFDNLSDVDSNADARPVIWEWLKIAAKKGYDDEHQPFLDAMLATAEAVEKELPIEAEAAVEEIEAREAEDWQMPKVDKNTPQQKKHKFSHEPGWSFKEFAAINIDTGEHGFVDKDELDKFTHMIPTQEFTYFDTEDHDFSDFDDAMADQEGWTKIEANQDEAYEPQMDWEKPNPKEVLKKGMADALAKEIEDELEDEEEDTDESLKHLAGIKEDESSEVFQLMKKSLLRHKWYLENEEMDPNMVSSELRDVNDMIDAVDNGEHEPYLDTAVNDDYRGLMKDVVAKLNGKTSSIYGVDNNVLPPNAKPNPKSAHNSGEVEKNDAEQDALNPSELESINHMKKLAGVMSSNKALRPKKTEHQTTPRSIHKRNKT